MAWREAPYYGDAEQAALALTEAATRLSDRMDAMPDQIWDDVADHYTSMALGILTIATTNIFNRINATINELASATWS